MKHNQTPWGTQYIQIKNHREFRAFEIRKYSAAAGLAVRIRAYIIIITNPIRIANMQTPLYASSLRSRPNQTPCPQACHSLTKHLVSTVERWMSQINMPCLIPILFPFSAAPSPLGPRTIECQDISGSLLLVGAQCPQLLMLIPVEPIHSKSEPLDEIAPCLHAGGSCCVQAIS